MGHRRDEADAPASFNTARIARGAAGPIIDRAQRVALFEHAADAVERQVAICPVILDLAERVKTLCSSKSEFEFIPYDEVYGLGIEDMYHRIPDIDKVDGAVGWKPTRTLDQILADVVNHFRHAPI